MFLARIPSRGSDIDFVPASGATLDAISSSLLGAALSYVLLRRGLEPLHATVVSSEGRSFGFLGDSGYGKSTLAALLITEFGCRLVTDDLLVIVDPSNPVPERGVERLKLEPAMADRFFGESGDPIAPGASKRLIPLVQGQVSQSEAPLTALFRLHAPDRVNAAAVSAVPCLESDAFQAILVNTFNSVIVERVRLVDQFSFAEALSKSVPMFDLSYPRGIDRLAEVAKEVMQYAAGR